MSEQPPQQFILLDLERTILSGRAHYWKAHSRGYTPDVYEAGMYLEDHARKLAEEDQDRRTVLISTKTLNDVLKLKYKK